MPRRLRRCRIARITSPPGEAIEAAVTETFAARLLGLAWVSRDAAPALLIPRCRSIHTFGMRFAIDVVFVAIPATGRTGEGSGGTAAVVDLRPAVGPRRVVSARGTRPDGTRVAALELRAGLAGTLGIGSGGSIEWSLRDRSGAASERGPGGDHD